MLNITAIDHLWESKPKPKGVLRREIRARLAEAQGGKCKCGAALEGAGQDVNPQNLVCIVPKYRGGSDVDPSNLVVVCKECDRLRSYRMNANDVTRVRRHGKVA
jgi:hypothetical protein